MKKTIIFFSLALAISGLSAQVTRGTVGNGSFTDYSGSTTQRKGLDFNNDGTLEFAINNGYDYDGNPVTDGAVEYVYSSTNNVATDADMWDYFTVYGQNQTINAATSFNGQGDCFFEDYTAISTPKYVGFRVKGASSIHYGYAKVSYNGSAVTWHEIYYNATPSAAITTGQTSGGTQGISDVDRTPFIVAAMTNCRINIVQETPETINIFDLSGRKVTSTNSLNATITLPAAGVYVLRSATASAQIVVR